MIASEAAIQHDIGGHSSYTPSHAGTKGIGIAKYWVHELRIAIAGARTEPDGLATGSACNGPHTARPLARYFGVFAWRGCRGVRSVNARVGVDVGGGCGNRRLASIAAASFHRLKPSARCRHLGYQPTGFRAHPCRRGPAPGGPSRSVNRPGRSDVAVEPQVRPLNCRTALHRHETATETPGIDPGIAAERSARPTAATASSASAVHPSLRHPQRRFTAGRHAPSRGKRPQPGVFE